MANGEYGDLTWYSSRKSHYKFVYCTDGAAAKAMDLGIVPCGIVGDMDSISQGILNKMIDKGVEIYRHPPEKDYTDAYLALKLMVDRGFNEIVIWGAMGGRLDHTLANIMSVTSFVEKSVKIMFDEPGLAVDIINSKIAIQGEVGDIVSIFPLGKEALGVTISGFKYPLKDARLSYDYPVGISNILENKSGSVSVEKGSLAIFHYL